MSPAVRAVKNSRYTLGSLFRFEKPSLSGEVAFHVDRGHLPIQGTSTSEPARGVEISIECG